MKLHEYQSRDLLERAGLPAPRGAVARTADAAAVAFAELSAPAVVVKAQVFAGGRGKAGGVVLVRSADEAAAAATRMFSRPLVTAQTGPGGVPVRAVLVSVAVEVEREIYLAATIDRRAGVPVMMASSRGGVDIEQVAREAPDAIVREPFDATGGLTREQAEQLAERTAPNEKRGPDIADLIRKLATFFIANDCSLAEINPLALTRDGRVLAIDAKVVIDDNALFRHTALAALADPADADPSETRAHAAGLSYIAMGGDIGCLVNGAGLAMATMDIIKLHGGEPANFLDVGGGVGPAGAIEAFRVLLADPKVRAVLVNIFGGIAHCDLIADALIRAGREVGFRVPVVVRLAGTNVEPAMQLLRQAGSELPTLVTATDLADAAAKAVAAARGGGA